MDTLPLRAALRHGVVVALANWPLVLIHFTFESFYRVALAVPILGGAIMVAAVVGTEPGSLVGEGLQGTADLVIGALATAPAALTSFFVAIGFVGIGGQAIVFACRIGTLTVVVASERRAADVHMLPLGNEALQVAAAFSLEQVYEGARHFGRRALTLALWLGALYVVVGGAYLAAVVYGLSMAVNVTWISAWPLLVLVATAVGVVTIALVNLVYDLLQVIIVTDDCEVGAAAARLRTFVVQDSRQVIGIFAVMGGLMVLATAASLLAAAGVAVIAWVPFVSLVVIPLQTTAWVARGLVFQFMELTALAAYQTQYRRLAFSRSHPGGFAPLAVRRPSSAPLAPSD
jgi:hypothetical protein